MSTSIVHENTHECVCPWCGYEQDTITIHAIAGDAEERHCYSCNRKYRYIAIMLFKTSKAEQ